ncbi:transcription termination factor 1-like isoform 1-T2 [Odontesthes bonariensis]|uniref:transcription termination factor 1-like n=1 Tax=Odontesthes bonariensis TaxID=219752 RepID=UPI003F58A5EC
METGQKRKRKSEEEPLAPVDIDTPERRKKKKKKKKTEEEEEVREVSLPHQTTKKVKVELSPVAIETSEAEKKKKRKKSDEQASGVTMETTHIKKKKKKKRKEEESVPIATGINGEQDSEVTMETTQIKKKKKKKREEESVPIATGIDWEQDSEVTMETTPIKKKKKKRKEEESVPIATNSSWEQDSEVAMETTQIKKKKKKKREEESVPIATGINGEQDSEVTMETTRIKKKKDGRESEGTSQERGKKKEKGEKGTIPIDWALVEELEEYIPGVKNRTAVQIDRLLRYDLKRLRNFKRQGLALRFGRCTGQENRQIRRNVADFLALTGISSATQLMFPKRFKEKRDEIKKLRAQHRFLESIAEGIPRPCEQVYIRAKKMFDVGNHRGRFSEEEVHSLTTLQTLHGNNWKVISEKMDRSIYALEKRFACITGTRGLWSMDEELRLKDALRAHLQTRVQRPAGSGLTREQLSKNLPWREISQKVETRNWVQCRLKWFSILQKRLNSTTDVPGRAPEAIEEKICLINMLYQKSVDDIADMEWDEVSQALGKMTRVSAQKMFHTLKVSKVPHWNSLSYGEIIDFLHRHVVPVLKVKLSVQRGRAEHRVQQVEDRYHLSDIFSNAVFDDEDVVDNS